MGMFDNIGEKFQGVAKKSGELAQTAAKKSGEMLETGKLNLQIKDEESKIKLRCEAMGRQLYEMYENANDIPGEFAEFIAAVKEMYGNIDSIKQQIEALREEGKR